MKTNDLHSHRAGSPFHLPHWDVDLNLAQYHHPSYPQRVTAWVAPDVPRDQRILRMMVKRPNGKIHLPPELEWIRLVLEVLTVPIQKDMGKYDDRFIYITVRSGKCDYVTDDEWHVDGFSLRTPHQPEQNYIWSDKEATQWLGQTFTIPDDFDGLKHNIHHFIQERALPQPIVDLVPKSLYLIDPYLVHRRPPNTADMDRAFFRISYVPIEIEDDTCQQNPLLPSGPYNRPDVRETTLTRYTKESK